MVYVWTKKAEKHWAKKYPNRKRKRIAGHEAIVAGDKVEYDSSPYSLYTSLKEKQYIRLDDASRRKMRKKQDELIREKTSKSQGLPFDEVRRRVRWFQECSKKNMTLKLQGEMYGMSKAAWENWVRRNMQLIESVIALER